MPDREDNITTFSRFYEKLGCSTIAAIVFFLVIIGKIPSAMTQNQETLKSIQEKLELHHDQQRDRTEKLIRRTTAQCVNPAIDRADRVAVNICLEDSEYRQKNMIEKALDKKETGK